VTAAASLRLTLDEWANLAEDVEGELVNGSLLEEEVPTLVHECVVRFFLLLLAPYFEQGGGQVFGSGVKLAVRRDRGRIADVICFGPGKKPEARGAVHVAPDIVIEVVSDSREDERRDRIEKPEDYAAFGVQYYWLVDPQLRSFEVWELDANGRYARACAVTEGRVDVVPGCERLTIDVDALWAQVDRLIGA
jgi:Uma2 family endonuclease